MQSEGLSSARLLEGNGFVLAGGLPRTALEGPLANWAWGDRDTTHVTPVVCGQMGETALSTGSVLGSESGPGKAASCCISSPSWCPTLLQVHVPHCRALVGGGCPCVWSQPDPAPLKHPIVPMCPTAEQTKVLPGLRLLMPSLPTRGTDTVTPIACGAGRGWLQGNSQQ